MAPPEAWKQITILETNLSPTTPATSAPKIKPTVFSDKETDEDDMHTNIDIHESENASKDNLCNLSIKVEKYMEEARVDVKE